MAFPVDIMDTVNPGSLEQSAKSYMSELLCKNSEISDCISVPASEKIEINLCNVGFVSLYGADIKEKILAVFSPEKPLEAVGLYLLDRWWSAEDILKTTDSSRTGLIQVRTPGERIVLYVLNRIIYRTEEMVRDKINFLCHGEDEVAKILWKNGNAIGFYSVKPEVSVRLRNRFLTKRYQLPVMDTVFIRKCHRGHGYGVQMLKDFVTSFREDFVGLSNPLSAAMYKVCQKYLSLSPENRDVLWEIMLLGSPFQTGRKIQATDPKGITIPELGESSCLTCEQASKNISRVKDVNPDLQSEKNDSVQEKSNTDFYIKDMIKAMTLDPDITHLHNEKQNNLTPQLSHQSEIENLNSSEDLQPLEHQQAVDVEMFNMFSETKITNIKDIEVVIKMGEILMVENVVDDTEVLDVEKEKVEADTGKEQSKKVKEKHTVEDHSEAEMTERIENKKQLKRKPVAELTPRRSKRLERAKIE